MEYHANCGHPNFAKPPRLRLSFGTLSSTTLQFREWSKTFAHGSQVLLLIGGEGSKKQTLAHEIHAIGVRRDKPFMRLPCGSLPAGTPFENLMFGNLPSLTSDSEGFPGVLQSTNGGTLFLEDVNLLTERSQLDLFAALEAEQVVPLGSCLPIAVDVRTLASVNASILDRESDECVMVRVPLCVLAAYLTELRILGSSSGSQGGNLQAQGY